MINPFDSNTGSSFSRRRSDVAMMSGPISGTSEDKPVICEISRTSSNKNSYATPMKMLIAQEMLKDAETKHNSRSVVAKLMGLDTIPQQQSNSVEDRIHSRSNTPTPAWMRRECWQQGNDFMEKQMQCKIRQSSQQTSYKDVYEVWQQSQTTNCIREKSVDNRRYNDELFEKKMDFVRDNFMEAKRLATNDKLRKSKEFQDALEVLSSNKDLFLKFLQEPNSLLSQQLNGVDSISPPDTKRITLLRPTKMVDDNYVYKSGKRDEDQLKKPSRAWKENGRHQNIHGLSHTAEWRPNDSPTQPTRIVVLKPSPGKFHDLPSLSPRTVHGEYFYGEPEDDEARQSREVAKEITRKIRENLSSHRRDETLYSSVCSNGYIGDESSCHKSENDFGVEDLSDCEVISPTSWHSWDDINRFGTSVSSSSFSPASYSRESSVCREAKKRLSQRWAKMTLNENYQEQRCVHRSSNTLGEMLAFSETKKSVYSVDGDVHKDQELRASTSCLASTYDKDGSRDESPGIFLRSKSLPVSSTLYGARLNFELTSHEIANTPESVDLTKAKSVKTSLKGKVSSLFFPRIKKSSNEQFGEHHSKTESQTVSFSEADNVSHCINDSIFEKNSPSLRGSSRDSVGAGTKQSIFSDKVLPITKHVISANPFLNQDQPSPISVLEPPFLEDDNPYLMCYGNVKPDRHGTTNSAHPIISNLIDKSPPIGSISRTLSANLSAEKVNLYPCQPFLVSSEPNEEQDWFLLVQTLLSMAGFHGAVHSESCLGRYYSPESPLDPMLREKYVNMDDNEFLQDVKRRQLRLSRKLIFDCVNEALVDITCYGSNRSNSGKPFSLANGTLPLLVDRVWSLIKEWFFDEAICDSNDGGEVRKEVVGKIWNDWITTEKDNLENEIEKRLIEELVEEVVVEFTGSLTRR